MKNFTVELFVQLINYFENTLGRQLTEKEKELIKWMANKEAANR